MTRISDSFLSRLFTGNPWLRASLFAETGGTYENSGIQVSKSSHPYCRSSKPDFFHQKFTSLYRLDHIEPWRELRPISESASPPSSNFKLSW
jgi:hypothetical protein